MRYAMRVQDTCRLVRRLSLLPLGCETTEGLPSRAPRHGHGAGSSQGSGRPGNDGGGLRPGGGRPVVEAHAGRKRRAVVVVAPPGECLMRTAYVGRRVTYVFAGEEGQVTKRHA